ncbi:hypothetical protein M8J75_013595 [Diaphorina citri]|nr:hypothetical protein M8J75_013595 [Diaphorina citri]KAI5724466.1 hypothetical protein M8J77_002996 [Diaphorina citri]
MNSFALHNNLEKVNELVNVNVKDHTSNHMDMGEDMKMHTDEDVFGLRMFHSSSPINIPRGYQENFPEAPTTNPASQQPENVSQGPWSYWNCKSPLESVLNSFTFPTPESTTTPPPAANNFTPLPPGGVSNNFTTSPLGGVSNNFTFTPPGVGCVRSPVRKGRNVTPPRSYSLTPPSSPLQLDTLNSSTDGSSPWNSSTSPILSSPIWTPTKSDLISFVTPPDLIVTTVQKDFSNMSLFSDRLSEPTSWGQPTTTVPVDSFPIGVWQNPSGDSPHSPSSNHTTEPRYLAGRKHTFPTQDESSRVRESQAGRSTSYAPRKTEPPCSEGNTSYAGGNTSYASPVSGSTRGRGGDGDTRRGSMCCNYCKKNNECEMVYTSHRLHEFDSRGKRIVTCPILSLVVCSYCHATGPDAHSEAYCPVKPGGRRDGKSPLVLKLLSGRTSSNTRRRTPAPGTPGSPRKTETGSYYAFE